MYVFFIRRFALSVVQNKRFVNSNACLLYVTETTYAPKNIFVHMFSKKHMDVIEKTNIRHLRLTDVSRKFHKGENLFSSLCKFEIIRTKMETSNYRKIGFVVY